MTAKRQPTKNDDDEFKITLGKGTMSWRVLVVVLLLGGNPQGQKILEGLGLHTPTKDIELIRADVTSLKEKAVGIDGKVNSIIVEMERLKLEAAKLAVKPL